MANSMELLVHLSICLSTCFLLLTAEIPGPSGVFAEDTVVVEPEIAPPLISSNDNKSSEAEIQSTKPPPIKFANADGEVVDGDADSFAPEEFSDRKVLLKRNLTIEIKREEDQRKLMNESCFHVPEEFCEYHNFTAELLASDNNTTTTTLLNLCPCKPHPFVKEAIICCNVTSIVEARRCYDRKWPQRQGITQIHIRNATVTELDMSDSWWKRFNKIAVTDGHIPKMIKTFTMHMKLSCLNVSNNHLLEMNARTFKSVQNFTVLDLSHNNLTQIPNVSHITNLTVNILESGMLCKVVQEAIEAGMNFAERRSTVCISNHTLGWFNSTDRVTIVQLYHTKHLQKECPPGCRCAVDRLTYDDNSEISQIVYSAKVDCSNLGLLELPEQLPTNTHSLNVSNNNITSLKALNSVSYQSVVRLYADDNNISTLLDLEGTFFLEEFEVLFLRRNKLKQIPIYLLSNQLDKNPRGKLLYFSGNKLNCDCQSAKVLRLFLLGHQNHIKDYDEIMCENLHQNVTQLSEIKLCQSKHDWTDYIFYLIAAEVLLLLVLVLKVSYDYYVFKTQSYLPWPANKMPKLPCDWLCET